MRGLSSGRGRSAGLRCSAKGREVARRVGCEALVRLQEAKRGGAERDRKSCAEMSRRATTREKQQPSSSSAAPCAAVVCARGQWARARGRGEQLTRASGHKERLGRVARCSCSSAARPSSAAAAASASPASPTASPSPATATATPTPPAALAPSLTLSLSLPRLRLRPQPPPRTLHLRLLDDAERRTALDRGEECLEVEGEGVAGREGEEVGFRV